MNTPIVIISMNIGPDIVPVRCRTAGGFNKTGYCKFAVAFFTQAGRDQAVWIKIEEDEQYPFERLREAVTGTMLHLGVMDAEREDNPGLDPTQSE